jgi:hypothetical protein
LIIPVTCAIANQVGWSVINHAMYARRFGAVEVQVVGSIAA